MDALTPNEEVAMLSPALREDRSEAAHERALAQAHRLYAALLRANAGPRWWPFSTERRARMLHLAEQAERTAEAADRRGAWAATRFARLANQVAQIVEQAYNAPTAVHAEYNKAHLDEIAFIATGRYLTESQPLTAEQWREAKNALFDPNDIPW
ncbi:hypothetical protein ABZ234_08115 [Nocardiopsis sp. NPDC006198]|uniref:hypothetical protein n=1 Tax=Nocardiopsis sp. NPDC006198 TaxID=3154472 RepID=UPI0033A32C45